MKNRFFPVLLLFFPFISFAQNNNFHVLTDIVDGSYVNQGTSTTLKVKMDERFTDYEMSLSQIKVYQSADNPISNFVTAINNQSATGNQIKRGMNLLELTLTTSQATGYYILEIPDSKGNRAYLRFYYDSGLAP
jgi:hypothetical protein